MEILQRFQVLFSENSLENFNVNFSFLVKLHFVMYFYPENKNLEELIFNNSDLSVKIGAKIHNLFLETFKSLNLTTESLSYLNSFKGEVNLTLAEIEGVYNSLVLELSNTAFLPDLLELYNKKINQITVFEKYNLSRKEYNRKSFNRHKKGAFYTPNFIVEGILQTIFNLFAKNLTRKQEKITKLPLKIGDISCGAGNFIQSIPKYFSPENFYLNIRSFDKDPVATEIAYLNFILCNHSHLNRIEINLSHEDILASKLTLKGYDILIGNPPWGIDLNPYNHILETQYSMLLQKSVSKKSLLKIRDQIDSFAIFLILNLKLLKPGGMVALIIPSTILSNPVYFPLRKYLLENYSILQIDYLGEDVFLDVTMPSLVIYIQNVNPLGNHSIKIQFFDSQKLSISQKLVSSRSYSIEQIEFTMNPTKNFQIFSDNKNIAILAQIGSRSHLNLKNFVTNSRGVEIGKTGKVYRCPNCTNWNPLPLWKKGPSSSVSSGKLTAKCNICKNIFQKSEEKFHEDVIIIPQTDIAGAVPTDYAPIIFGKDLQPNKFCSDHYIKLNYPGIKYKTPELYQKKKILIRKTGKGIIGAIDYQGHYTVQVIYLFGLKSNNSQNDMDKYSLEYLFGILTSKVIQYYYMHRFSNPTKKVFPHLIQSNLLAIPIPVIDFKNDGSRSYELYSIITNAIKKLNSPQPSHESLENLILQKESAVVELFGLENIPDLDQILAF
jgi:TaqI-like C-terminal specificity domain/N-6 DNA Methylase